MRAKERLPRKHYSPEFKMELVRLALEEEGSIAALARKHDVNDNLLFKWIRLWQREGRVCRPRKNSSSLPALIPVQLQAGSSLPTFEHRRWSVPADKATGTWSLRLALSPRWQSVPDAGATGDADGRYRLATAKAVTDIPDHVVALFILVVAE